jgi:hypothetical protein
MADIDEIYRLKKIFQDSIYSIIKYGFGKRNILVVIKNGNIDYLLNIRPFIRKLKKTKNILLLSYDDIKQKTIGLDLLNIKLTSVVIYGSDIFSEMNIDNLRIKRQIKYEAYRQLVTLKNDLLSTRWEFQMKQILFSVVPRVLPLIVAHLYIKGENITNAIPDTINKYIKYNEDALVLLRIKKNISSSELKELFTEMFLFLGKLSEKV